MTKETLMVLCASLCMSLATPLIGLSDAYAQTKEIRKANTAQPSADSQSGEHGLLADGLKIKEKIKTHRRLRDVELKRELERAALQAPSEDLYGEDSWTGKVNPFAGLDANIPESYDIDLDGFVMPIDRKQITSHYGYRARFGRMHYGTDLAVNIGDTVKAAFSGKVRVASYEGAGYGNYIVIRHPNGLETVYGHLHRRIVTEGTIVKAGDPIGLGGNTGRSTGPHLHFEARFMGIPLNPDELFDLELGAPRLDRFAFRRHEHYRKGRVIQAHRSRIVATPAKEKEQTKTHRIRKGDTLSKIAQLYGTTISKLQELNGMSGSNLKAGKSIRVS